MAIADVVDEAERLTASLSPARADSLAADFARAAGLIDPREPEFTAAALPGLAEAVRAGRRRRTRGLADAVRAILMLADRVEAELCVPDLVLGTVALYMATAAPLERRVVVAGHALRATDAEWAFGRGPVLEGTQLEIVRFLLGLSEVPPRPVSAVDGEPSTGE